MAIPSYETLMLPVLKLFASGARNVSECLPAIKQQFRYCRPMECPHGGGPPTGI
jgi:hypothetical protein